jgi:hypothetical protein
MHQSHPELNIALFIKEIRHAASGFATAKLTRDAVTELVMNVEKPDKKQEAIDKRTAIADMLLS